MANKHRPLSPHLSIYKPQMTSVLSISHRFTGIALVIGLPVLIWFLTEVAFGDIKNSLFSIVMTGPVGIFMLIGWTYALAFHLCNGIRHLLWDIGWGFDMKTLHITGWVVVISSVILTGLLWACVAGQEGWLS